MKRVLKTRSSHRRYSFPRLRSPLRFLGAVGLSHSHRKTLGAGPLELRDDAAALRLALAGIQDELGDNPDHYVPRPFWGGALCGRNQSNPKTWAEASALSPVSGRPTSGRRGIIRAGLEQGGTTVTCTIAPAK